MKKYRALTALVIAAAFLTGCSAQEQSSDSSQPEPTSEVTPTAEPTAQAPTEERFDEAPEQTTAPETSAPEEISAPAETLEASDNTESYIADWIYGTWSVMTVNGADYWSYAGANGFDSEYQLIFDKDGCQRLDGSAGLTDIMSYRITDSGAELYTDDGEVWAELTYNQTADTLSAERFGDVIVLKRGENPRQNAPQVDYIADWIYGTWSVITLDGKDFWDWADENGVSGEYILSFNAQNVEAFVGTEPSGTYYYRITDDGAEIFNDDGSANSLVYDPAADTLTLNSGGITGVLARGENPRQ